MPLPTPDPASYQLISAVADSATLIEQFGPFALLIAGLSVGVWIAGLVITWLRENTGWW